MTTAELNLVLQGDRQVVAILLREAYSKVKANKIFKMYDNGENLDDILYYAKTGDARLKLSEKEKGLIVRTINSSEDRPTDVKVLARKYGVTRVYINYLVRNYKLED